MNQPLTIAYANASLIVQLSGNCITATDWQLCPEQPSDTALASEITLFLHRSVQTPIPFQLQAVGTTFDLRVWAAIGAIPLGETRSYKQLAEQLNNAPRAIANACRRNPFPGLIPCHRVTATNGIGGFMGAIDGEYIALKQQLLAYEKEVREAF